MRKTITPGETLLPSHGASWLDVQTIARVEVTSEDPAFPIEEAFSSGSGIGWRAAQNGPQTVRLVFDAPQRIRSMHLHVVERSADRMQELSLFATIHGERRELRRQQFTFSPGGATEEIENFPVDLSDVTSVELRIDPDRSHDPRQSLHRASLLAFRVA